ncbi:hypothetical protein Fmac_018383 [Flemingia macrophylla]|uniref:Uncharacterized protein n=1 Tax=Flemingia macrophylla TaxID=520843 RepID=A0ABD1M4T7_9FABA
MHHTSQGLRADLGFKSISKVEADMKDFGRASKERKSKDTTNLYWFISMRDYIQFSINRLSSTNYTMVTRFGVCSESEQRKDIPQRQQQLFRKNRFAFVLDPDIKPYSVHFGQYGVSEALTHGYGPSFWPIRVVWGTNTWIRAVFISTRPNSSSVVSKNEHRVKTINAKKKTAKRQKASKEIQSLFPKVKSLREIRVTQTHSANKNLKRLPRPRVILHPADNNKSSLEQSPSPQRQDPLQLARPHQYLSPQRQALATNM